MKRKATRLLATLLTLTLLSSLVLTGSVWATPEDPEVGETFLYGDVDFNNEVDSSDARLVLQYEVKAIYLHDTAFEAGNVDSSDDVDSTKQIGRAHV